MDLDILALRVMRAVPTIGKVRPPAPATWPSLSVVIPAGNEAETLEGAVATRLGDPYPSLEAILLADRSSDGPDAIVDRIAASDPRVRAVDIESLPEGWLGKVNALARER